MCDKLPMTEAEANRIVNISRRKFRDKYGQYHKPTKDIPRRVYWCKECQAFHVIKHQ